MFRQLAEKIGRLLAGKKMPKGARLWLSNQLIQFAKTNLIFDDTGKCKLNISRSQFAPRGVWHVVVQPDPTGTNYFLTRYRPNDENLKTQHHGNALNNDSH